MNEYRLRDLGLAFHVGDLFLCRRWRDQDGKEEQASGKARTDAEDAANKERDQPP